MECTHNTQKFNGYVLTFTDFFLNQYSVNVCEIIQITMIKNRLKRSEECNTYLYCINGVVIAALMHCDLSRSIVLPRI